MLTTKCYKNLIIFPKSLSPPGMGREGNWGEKEQLPHLWEGDREGRLPVGLLCSGKASWRGILGFLASCIWL